MKVALNALKPEEMEITFKRIDKQNRKGLHGCVLMMPGSIAAPTFYLEDLYEAYCGGTAAEDIAQSMINYAKENNQAVFPSGIDIEDYESVRKQLGLMLIGAEENKEYLETLVHEIREGLAMVPFVLLKNKDNTGCIKIKKEFLELWDVTEQQVMDEAVQNAPKIMPPNFRAMEAILGVKPSPVSDSLCAPEEAELFVVTNDDCSWGASVVFYPGMLESIREALGRDFYVLPSSINEILVLRDFGQDPIGLLEIVKSVNRKEVPPEEVLADAVFRYSRSEGFRRVLPLPA